MIFGSSGFLLFNFLNFDVNYLLSPKIEFFYAVSRGTLHKFDFNYFIVD